MVTAEGLGNDASTESGWVFGHEGIIVLISEHSFAEPDSKRTILHHEPACQPLVARSERQPTNVKQELNDDVLLVPCATAANVRGDEQQMNQDDGR